MNLENVTLFTKDQLSEERVIKAMRTGLFTITPVIRNLVQGADAEKRNSQVKFPLEPTFGFDLFYRIMPARESYENSRYVAGPAIYSMARIGDQPVHALNGADWDEVPNAIHFKTLEKAFEAIASLHVHTCKEPETLSLAWRPADDVSKTLSLMVTFKNVFGRFPRDSEKIDLGLIENIIIHLGQQGVKAKYPMKAMAQYDTHYSSYHDKSKVAPTTDEFESFVKRFDRNNSHDYFKKSYFKMACYFVNFETAMAKLSRVFDQQAEADLLKQAENPDNQGPFGPLHLYGTKEELRRRDFTKIADHLMSPFTAKSEAFFLKYYKADRLHTLLDLCMMVDEPDFPQSGNWIVFETYLTKAAGRRVLIDVEKRLNMAGFSWKNLRLDLPMTEVSHEGTTVRMLEQQDTTALMLGKLTNCCQRLNGAGESCMFEGIVNPNSGFLVIESAGQILAQAWVWESKEGQLILDNLEFADFKGIESIKEALTAWLTASPFEEIQIGTGYMEVKFGGDRVSDNQLSWYKKKVWSNNLYTDAARRKWLKRDGQVTV